MVAVTGQGGQRRRRRKKRKRISVLIHGGCASPAPVPSLQWHCQHLAWAHRGLLMPTVSWWNAWNVRSPLLPVSLQCRSADVTNCRPSAQAPSCRCSTTLPPSCAFSFQHKASPRPCPDPPAPTLWLSHTPSMGTRQEPCEAEQAFHSQLCQCPPGQSGQLVQGLSALLRGDRLVRHEAVTTTSSPKQPGALCYNPTAATWRESPSLGLGEPLAPWHRAMMVDVGEWREATPKCWEAARAPTYLQGTAVSSKPAWARAAVYVLL